MAKGLINSSTGYFLRSLELFSMDIIHLIFFQLQLLLNKGKLVIVKQFISVDRHLFEFLSGLNAATTATKTKATTTTPTTTSSTRTTLPEGRGSLSPFTTRSWTLSSGQNIRTFGPFKEDVCEPISVTRSVL